VVTVEIQHSCMRPLLGDSGRRLHESGGLTFSAWPRDDRNGRLSLVHLREDGVGHFIRDVASWDKRVGSIVPLRKSSVKEGQSGPLRGRFALLRNEVGAYLCPADRDARMASCR